MRANSLNRLAAFCICVVLIPGCASQPSSPAPGLQIKGLVINNQTQMWITAARLLVPATGAFVSCGNISPRSACATTFPETDYSGNPVQITWSQGGQIHSTPEFVIQLPRDIDVDEPAFVRVVISGPGSAGAAIVQNLATSP